MGNSGTSTSGEVEVQEDEFVTDRRGERKER